MSCNIDFFMEQEKVIRNTWLKPVIEGAYKDVDYYFYTSGERDFIDDDSHQIYVKCNDDWYATFEKTRKAMEMVMRRNDYDYIVRVNLSTYVNVPLLLMFIKMKLDICHDDYHVWGVELLQHNSTKYMIGKFLLFPKPAVMDLINCDEKFHTQRDADDYVIGCVLNDPYRLKQLPPFNAYPRDGAERWNHNVFAQDFDWDDCCKHIAISYRTYPGDYQSRSMIEPYIANLIHKQMEKHETRLEDVVELFRYHNNVCLNIDHQAYELHREKYAVAIYCNKSELDENEQIYVKDIVAKYGNTHDIYLLCTQGTDSDVYYTAADNLYMQVVRLDEGYENEDGFNRIITNKLIWQQFAEYYEHMLVFNGIGPSPVIIDELYDYAYMSFTEWDGVAFYNCDYFFTKCDENEHPEGIEFFKLS